MGKRQTCRPTGDCQPVPGRMDGVPLGRNKTHPLDRGIRFPRMAAVLTFAKVVPGHLPLRRAGFANSPQKVLGTASSLLPRLLNGTANSSKTTRIPHLFAPLKPSNMRIEASNPIQLNQTIWAKNRSSPSPCSVHFRRQPKPR